MKRRVKKEYQKEKKFGTKRVPRRPGPRWSDKRLPDVVGAVAAAGGGSPVSRLGRSFRKTCLEMGIKIVDKLLYNCKQISETVFEIVVIVFCVRSMVSDREDMSFV